MKESTAKEKILKNIRNGLIQTSAVPCNENIDLENQIFVQSEDEIDITFAKEFVKNGGKFIYCENFNEFTEEFTTLMSREDFTSKEILCKQNDASKILIQAGIDYISTTKESTKIDIGICNCEYLISRTGTIIVSSGIEDSVKILSLSEIAIVIATPSQIIPDIKISMQKLQDKYKNLPSVINYVSGPTLHYCFENKPSQGVGVKELYLILIDNMY
ncbi:MAG: hypothetical protein A2X12_00945 [Bacteroidetes bacterium GWE2_29_8]|nr:MAG: hypothetical protein A2X12_00945 [Bacteroidetes bacterium GWE2_29_8]OFY15644.1 MAG: hypothetical protein A2X02_06415 [Bacteroidetes bacterium GWF2_29_10]